MADALASGASDRKVVGVQVPPRAPQSRDGDDVSAATTQTLIAGVLSLVFVVTVYRLGRKQRLSFRYTAGWLVLGMLGVLAGLLLPFAEPIADWMNVQPAALLALGALILLLLLCVQLSISISGLQEQVRRLAEESSFLRREIDQLGRGTSDDA